MIAMKPFTQGDWYGLCGAERFPGGEEPLLGEALVDGQPVLVVYDAQGIAIIGCGDEVLDGCDEQDDYICNDPHGACVVQAALRQLTPDMTGVQLLALGFQGPRTERALAVGDVLLALAGIAVLGGA